MPEKSARPRDCGAPLAVAVEAEQLERSVGKLLNAIMADA